MSTCLEILEYEESARSLARDFRLALTKVSLIKQRLHDWGTTMSVKMPHGADTHDHDHNPNSHLHKRMRGVNTRDTMRNQRLAGDYQ